MGRGMERGEKNEVWSQKGERRECREERGKEEMN